MNQSDLKNILEAALMAHDKPMSINNFMGLFKDETDLPEREQIRDALKVLQEEFTERGVELVEVASGFRFQVRSEYSKWVNTLFEERPARYSRALLETLAIIAYRQPITRAEIEQVRGVSISSSILKTLQEREWIRVVGHRDVPGKPELLATTREFLDYFNLKKLSELPSLSEIKDFDQLNPDLFEGIDPPAKETEVSESNVDTESVAAHDEAENTDNEDKVVPLAG